ncbi:MAG: methylenetetrahydrofolate reductase C-terminal domain-containing protein [Dehalococcoidales bacterium]|nr:methylenetetrahydrofolate reductase C-terminal domain-containing protein [Dehalococcoidales bacterium]
MIVTTLKPLDELLGVILPYSDILVVGCDGCNQPPRGLREASTLSQLLDLAGKPSSKVFNFKITTVGKQCDDYMAASVLKPQIGNTEAVLSLACGLGVQTLAKVFPELPVFPAQNTHFMGAEDRDDGILEMRCAGCGDCLLAVTGGICPVARCPKGLLNGACGGAKDDKCELSPEKDCAWVLIYNSLKNQGKLDLLRGYRPPRDYQLTGWKITT